MPASVDPMALANAQGEAAQRSMEGPLRGTLTRSRSLGGMAGIRSVSRPRPERAGTEGMRRKRKFNLGQHQKIPHLTPRRPSEGGLRAGARSAGACRQQQTPC